MRIDTEYPELSSGKNTLSFFTAFYVCTLFFFLTGVINPFLTENLPYQIYALKGDPLMQGIWIILYLIGMVLIIRDRENFLTALKDNIVLVVLITYILFSFLWSSFPELSLRRSVALTLTTAMGVYLGARGNLETILALLARVYGFILILCLISILITPDYGTYYVEYGIREWKGIFANKNCLGYNMFLSFMVWSWASTSRMFRRATALFFLGVSVVLLLLSNSMTSILIFLVMMFAYTLYAVSRYDREVFLGIASIAAALIVFASVSFLVYLADHSLSHFFINFLGRDITLTARTIIWESVWTDILKMFWFGYGQDGYWAGTGQSFAFLVQEINPIELSGAHNGVLEVWLNIGLTGVILLLVYFFLTMAKVFKLTRVNRNETLTAFIILFITAFTAYNFAENHFLHRNNILWVLFVAISSHLSPGLNSGRLTASQEKSRGDMSLDPEAASKTKLNL